MSLYAKKKRSEDLRATVQINMISNPKYNAVLS